MSINTTHTTHGLSISSFLSFSSLSAFTTGDGGRYVETETRLLVPCPLFVRLRLEDRLREDGE